MKKITLLILKNNNGMFHLINYVILQKNIKNILVKSVKMTKMNNVYIDFLINNKGNLK